MHEVIVDDVGKVVRWKAVRLHQNLQINASTTNLSNNQPTVH